MPHSLAPTTLRPLENPLGVYYPLSMSKMKKFREDGYKEPKVDNEKEQKEKSIVFGNREQGFVLTHDNVDGPKCFKCGQTSIKLLLILSLFPVRSVKRRIGTGSP